MSNQETTGNIAPLVDSHAHIFKADPRTANTDLPDRAIIR